MEPLIALLLQSETSGTGIFRFFVGFLLVLTVVSGAFGFTYWISKDE